jgi:hypothetical protein
MVSSHPDELSSTRQTQTHTSSSSSCVVVSPGASQLLEPRAGSSEPRVVPYRPVMYECFDGEAFTPTRPTSEYRRCSDRAEEAAGFWRVGEGWVAYVALRGMRHDTLAGLESTERAVSDAMDMSGE